MQTDKRQAALEAISELLNRDGEIYPLIYWSVFHKYEEVILEALQAPQPEVVTVEIDPARFTNSHAATKNMGDSLFQTIKLEIATPTQTIEFSEKPSSKCKCAEKS